MSKNIYIYMRIYEFETSNSEDTLRIRDVEVEEVEDRLHSVRF